jgi:hypothetical protein
VYVESYFLYTLSLCEDIYTLYVLSYCFLLFVLHWYYIQPFVVDALHVVLEGLVAAKLGRKIFRHGGNFGTEMLLLDTPIESTEYACAITFVACSVCYRQNLCSLLDSNRYPKTALLARR